MSLIHYYVHGRGLGHATRSLPIIARLTEAGYRVTAFGGEDAYPLMRSVVECHPVASLRPDQSLDLLPRLVLRAFAASRELYRTKAALVISDGDLPGIVAATLLGRPSIAVGHAEVFGECVRPKGVPAIPWTREEFRAKVSSLSATCHVAVNFVPVKPRSKSTVVATPVTILGDQERPDPNGRVVCYFRDNNGGEMLRALVDLGLKPTVFASLDPGVPGVEVRALNRSEFLASMAKARAVVASAGSQLIWECITHKVPLFALYLDSDDEQHLNVEMLRQVHRGDGCSFSEFSPDRLRRFLEAGVTAKSPAQEEMHAPDAATAVLQLVDRFLARTSP